MIKQGENIAFTGHFVGIDGEMIQDISQYNFRVVVVSHEIQRPVYVWTTNDDGISKGEDGSFSFALNGSETARLIPGWYGIEISLTDETGKVIGEVKKAFRLHYATKLPDDIKTGALIIKNDGNKGSAC